MYLNIQWIDRLFFTGSDHPVQVEFLPPDFRVAVHTLKKACEVQVWSTPLWPLDRFRTRIQCNGTGTATVGVCTLSPDGKVNRYWCLSALMGELLIGPKPKRIGSSGIFIQPDSVIRIDVNDDFVRFRCECSDKQSTLKFEALLTESELKTLSCANARRARSRS